MRASFGPTLRNMRASKVARTSVASTQSPMTTKMTFGIKPSFLVSRRMNHERPRQRSRACDVPLSLRFDIMPFPYVGDASFIAQHHHLRTALDGAAIF